MLIGYSTGDVHGKSSQVRTGLNNLLEPPRENEFAIDRHTTVGVQFDISVPGEEGKVPSRVYKLKSEWHNFAWYDEYIENASRLVNQFFFPESCRKVRVCSPHSKVNFAQQDHFAALTDLI